MLSFHFLMGAGGVLYVSKVKEDFVNRKHADC